MELSKIKRSLLLRNTKQGSVTGMEVYNTNQEPRTDMETINANHGPTELAWKLTKEIREPRIRNQIHSSVNSKAHF